MESIIIVSERCRGSPYNSYGIYYRVRGKYLVEVGCMGLLKLTI